MCVAIDRTIKSVSKSCEDMRRGNQIVVAQLQDELRALHREIDKERRALFTDRSSGVWNRHKIDSRLEDLVRRQDPFCVLMIGVQNLRGLYLQHSRTVIEGSLKAMLARLANLLGEDALIGRWSEDVFAAVLDVHPSVAEKLREQAEGKLSGTYSMQENGLARRVGMEVRVGVVEREKGADAATFYPRMGRVATIAIEVP
jgi:GGDEF domain-containing protein